MQGRDRSFENLRTCTLNFRLFELQTLSDTNQETNIIIFFFAPTSQKIYSVFIKRSIWLVVCIETTLFRNSQDYSIATNKIINYLILK
jgi:hypothetical protein